MDFRESCLQRYGTLRDSQEDPRGQWEPHGPQPPDLRCPGESTLQCDGEVGRAISEVLGPWASLGGFQGRNERDLVSWDDSFLVPRQFLIKHGVFSEQCPRRLLAPASSLLPGGHSLKEDGLPSPSYHL